MLSSVMLATTPHFTGALSCFGAWVADKSSSGRALPPATPGLGHPIMPEPGVEILATGILEYSSLKSGPQISIDDPTQIVFTQDLETAVPSP